MTLLRPSTSTDFSRAGEARIIEPVMLLATSAAPPPAPRPFRLRALDASTAVLLLIGPIWAIVGSIAGGALASAAGAPWNDMILDRRGVVAEALPTSVAPSNTRVNGRRVFHVAYTFADAAGATRSSSTATTNRELATEARLHARIAIEYDPSKPERSRIRGERSSLAGVLGLLPFGIAFAGFVVCAISARRAYRVRAIYVHGEATSATITDTTPTMMRINWQRVIRVNYTFSTIAGQIQGRTTTRSPPLVGTRIWVIYDEGDPRRSVAAI